MGNRGSSKDERRRTKNDLRGAIGSYALKASNHLAKLSKPNSISSYSSDSQRKVLSLLQAISVMGSGATKKKKKGKEKIVLWVVERKTGRTKYNCVKRSNCELPRPVTTLQSCSDRTPSLACQSMFKRGCDR